MSHVNREYCVLTNISANTAVAIFKVDGKMATATFAETLMLEIRCGSHPKAEGTHTACSPTLSQTCQVY
jgi:hypothetical protein